MAIYSETYGFVLTLKTNSNLSEVTNMVLRIKSPSGTTDRALTSAHILAPASKGVVSYTVVNGDFPVGGKYQIQLFDTTTGRRLASNIVSIDVKSSLTN